MPPKHSLSIRIVRDDITKLEVDAIVNAANKTLLGGGGVDGAIHRAAGPEFLEACRLLNGCQTGEAKITPAFRLPSKWVIHTVGPVWRGGLADEARLLARCYNNSLKLAGENNCQSIAFPNISTGVYGFPKPKAAEIAVKTTKEYLTKNQSSLTVYFVCFDDENHRLYHQLLKDL